MTVSIEATLAEVIRQASTRLSAAGVATPRVDATALLAFVLEADTGEVQRRALLGHRLPREKAGLFAVLVDRRCAREPLQHLTGRAAFRHLELAVGPGVFVPRPETETVAEFALAELRSRVEAGERPVAVDLCTGSGAIALALAHEAPDAVVHAVELSEDALVWARRNVDATGLPVTLHQGDVSSDLPELTSLQGTVAVVVSNPPYIPPDAVPVDAEVAEHDPPMALYGGGTDGLEVPRAVVRRAAALLAPDGLFVMEHADVQAGRVTRLLRDEGGWSAISSHEDLTGRPRAVTARRIGISEPGS